MEEILKKVEKNIEEIDKSFNKTDRKKELIKRIIEKTDEQIHEFVKENVTMYENDIYRIEESLADIILNNFEPNPKSFKSSSDMKNISTRKISKIISKFLKEYYDEDYVDKFIYAIENITSFTDTKYMDSSYNSDSNKIVLNFLNRIVGVGETLHEFFHYTNINPYEITETSSYFSETISFYNELLVYDFICKNYPKYSMDALACRYASDFISYETAIEFKILSYLLKEGVKGNKVTEETWNAAINSLSTIDDKYIVSSIMKLIYNLDSGDELACFGEEYILSATYVVANVISKYLYDLYKDDKKAIMQLNESIKILDIDEVYESLEIEINQDFNPNENSAHHLLSKESEKKLELIYKKEQKRA